MSLQTAMLRVAELQSVLAPPAPSPAPVAPVSAPGAAQSSFDSLLGGPAAPAAATAPTPAAGGTPAGRAALAIAQGEVGQAEHPPGSNDSPRIAHYRQATAGSMVAPWCAYFVSWAAREAGAPLGDSGQGFGAVADVWAWGQKTGKAFTPAQGRPQPGDLIVWSGHIGIVESIAADGSVNTIEGNSSHQVARRRHDATGDGALGYVRLG